MITPYPDLRSGERDEMDSAGTVSPFAPVRLEWLALGRERAIEPELPIIDCHHHLWTRPECPYEVEDLLADIGSGHQVRATVFVECRTRYRAAGTRACRSLGETEFAGEIGDRFRVDPRRPPRVNAGIVGYVDLQAGRDTVEELLLQHQERGRGCLRGIRNLSASQETHSFGIPSQHPSMLMSARFREGFAALHLHNLVFDAWMFHTQLLDLVDLAQTFPETPIVLNHCGGPGGIGPRAASPETAFRLWEAHLTRVARCENVFLKIGGLGMPHCGFGFHEQSAPPDSDELVAAWQPVVEHSIQCFGPGRCMFESNFPVDKGSYSYVTLWNAFKKLTERYSRLERDQMFSLTAARVYRLTLAS